MVRHRARRLARQSSLSSVRSASTPKISRPPSNPPFAKTTHAGKAKGDVAAKIAECNIRNYSIYLHDGLLFAYYEYIGNDFSADMQKMAADPTTQAWWATVKPLQSPLPSRAAGTWWAPMQEVFHQD